MRALSIRQPWAWAILHAGKRIENRPWWCAYRGPVLLHASKTCARNDYLAAKSFMRSDPLDVRPFPELADLDRGGIVGRARIVDCIMPGGRAPTQGAYKRSVGPVPRRGEIAPRHPLAADPWYVGDFGLVVADVEALPFVPWKGALGLFEVPDDYATRAARGGELP